LWLLTQDTNTPSYITACRCREKPRKPYYGRCLVQMRSVLFWSKEALAMTPCGLHGSKCGVQHFWCKIVNPKGKCWFIDNGANGRAFHRQVRTASLFIRTRWRDDPFGPLYPTLYALCAVLLLAATPCKLTHVYTLPH